MWGDRSDSLVPVVRSLTNLKGFGIRTEGINVALTPPIAEVFSLVLSKPNMEWIHFSDVRFIHGSNLFRVFMHAAPLRLLSLADISIDLKDQIIPDVPEYIPVRLDTLAVSFEIGRVMEEPIIRNALKRTVPLFDIDHIRCLQLHVYHAAEDMDRVHA
ncbi:hypothetical protein B0H11DRAFT_1275841 [Mycena galericulata]|nr:hypothetical protein B0H11DRAFT_1275841 [Mycena galericulata]